MTCLITCCLRTARIYPAGDYIHCFHASGDLTWLVSSWKWPFRLISFRDCWQTFGLNVTSQNGYNFFIFKLITKASVCNLLRPFFLIWEFLNYWSSFNSLKNQQSNLLVSVTTVWSFQDSFCLPAQKTNESFVVFGFKHLRFVKLQQIYSSTRTSCKILNYLLSFYYRRWFYFLSSFRL